MHAAVTARAVLIALAAIPAAANGRKTGDEFRDGWEGSAARLAPSMIWIESQEFLMGSDPMEFGYQPREARHRVELSGFAIGKTEVTNEQYAAFLNETGNRETDHVPYVLVGRSKSCGIGAIGGRFRALPRREKYPVVTVSWEGAKAYCEWLSKKTGQRYRLPSEAEWECAARAGSSSYWPWGDEWSAERLNCRGRTRNSGLKPVASFAPNAWGIYDMLGNAWEWVRDAFDSLFYLYSPLRNPVLLDAETWAPGIRGGSFRDGLEYCRPGYRANLWWWGDYDGVGFRVAREDW